MLQEGSATICKEMEKALLDNLKERKTEAVAQIVEEHTAVLLRGALGRGLPMADAEELVQETFVAFLKAVDRFEGRSSVRTFLFGILYRKAMERGRKVSRELATDPVDQIFEGRFGKSDGMWITPPKGPDENALTKETGVLIEQCLEGLSADQRSTFHLKEVDHLSTDEVCNIMGISATHLRVLLFRARNKLRECLERKWEERK